MATTYLLFGRNILEEALSVGAKVTEIYFENDGSEKFIRAALESAKIRNIALKRGLPSEVRDSSHQGVAFRVEHDFYIRNLEIDERKLPRILLCNHLEDVQNLGSIIRSAAAFGVNLIVHENRRSVALNAVAIKISAGQAFRMKFFEVSNLGPLCKDLMEAGYQTVGLDSDADSVDLYSWKPRLPMAMIVGSEAEGLSKSLQSFIELKVQISMIAGVESLNVSNATSVALSWAYSQTRT